MQPRNIESGPDGSKEHNARTVRAVHVLPAVSRPTKASVIIFCIATNIKLFKNVLVDSYIWHRDVCGQPENRET